MAGYLSKTQAPAGNASELRPGSDAPAGALSAATTRSVVHYVALHNADSCRRKAAGGCRSGDLQVAMASEARPNALRRCSAAPWRPEGRGYDRPERVNGGRRPTVVERSSPVP